MSEGQTGHQGSGSRTDDLFKPDFTFASDNGNTLQETQETGNSNNNNLSAPLSNTNGKSSDDQSPYRTHQNTGAAEEKVPQLNNTTEPGNVDSVSSLKLSSSFDQVSGSPTHIGNESKNLNQPASSVEEKKSDPNVDEDLSARITKTKTLKDSANFFVKGSLFEDAIKVYEASFYNLKLMARDRADPNFQKALQLQNDILNNLSYCYGSLERYQESIGYARRVLFTDHDNVKALFRLAIGNKNTGNLLTAFDDIKKCKEAFKSQNPDKPLDSKIHELYVSLRDSCKEQLDEQEKKEKEMYSKMMGTNKLKESKQTETVTQTNNQTRSPLAWKPIRYALYLGPTVILVVIAAKVIRQKSIEVAKNNIPAILTTLGAILCIRYLKNHVSKSVLGLSLAAAAALMVAKTRGSGYWSNNTRSL